MSDGWLRLLCALAAVAMPLAFAWAALRFGAWRHRRGPPPRRPKRDRLR